ncbi:hypothetical protein V5799_007772 [Amblyomma americanum]|uniref:Uncharacterized protein n=1 Tax=Amblyomma americanum TaxID=6943 RepID=A0AAQ4FGU5_AMBAM
MKSLKLFSLLCLMNRQVKPLRSFNLHTLPKKLLVKWRSQEPQNYRRHYQRQLHKYYQCPKQQLICLWPLNMKSLKLFSLLCLMNRQVKPLRSFNLHTLPNKLLVKWRNQEPHNYRKHYRKHYKRQLQKYYQCPNLQQICLWLLYMKSLKLFNLLCLMNRQVKPLRSFNLHTLPNKLLVKWHSQEPYNYRRHYQRQLQKYYRCPKQQLMCLWLLNMKSLKLFSLLCLMNRQVKPLRSFNLHTLPNKLLVKWHSQEPYNYRRHYQRQLQKYYQCPKQQLICLWLLNMKSLKLFSLLCLMNRQVKPLRSFNLHTLPNKLLVKWHSQEPYNYRRHYQRQLQKCYQCPKQLLICLWLLNMKSLKLFSLLCLMNRQPGAVELPEVLPETTAEVLPVPKAAADLPAPLTTPLTDAPEKLLHATLTQVARELEPPAAVELTKVQPETTTEALAVPKATADRPVASKQGEEPVAQPCVPCKAPEVILPASIIDEMAPAVKQTATSPQLHSHSEVTSLIPAYPAESNFKVVKEEAGAPVTQEAIAKQPEVFQEVVASSEKGVAKPNGLLIPLVTSETGMGIAAEAPGVTQSELAIAEALRESREEALKREGQEALLLEGIVAEVLLPELEEHEAEAASLETLARPLISERDLDQAQISGTSLPPIEPVTYADFQQSLKAPAGSLQSKTTDLVLVRLTPDYTASLPGADAKQLYLEGGEKIDTPIATASHRGAVEKEEEISQLAAAAIAVAEAAVIMEAQESQRCMPAEPSMTGSIVTAVSEFPVVLAVADASISQEIREKIADDIEMRPSVSRTALVAVIADERHEQPDAPCAALGAPSVTTTSSSAEDRSRPQQDQAEPSDGLQVPEPLVPALDDEIHAPMPTSFNVPVINIQYNFHFPAPGAPGPSGQQPPPSPEQAMAAQVLQGALAQQGIAGHIPGHHVLTPEQQAVRHMTERLNDIASRGTEPYTGRQSPARGTFFRQLPRKPVTPVPPLQPPPRASASQESRRRCGVRAVVFLLAFLMLIFIMLYALGLFGKKRYFMYYG